MDVSLVPDFFEGRKHYFLFIVGSMAALFELGPSM